MKRLLKDGSLNVSGVEWLGITGISELGSGYVTVFIV